MSMVTLEDLCEAGDVEAVQLYLRQQQQQQHPVQNALIQWNDGMARAAQHGYMSIVLLLIERGADSWNGGLYCAAKGGHILIVQLMIKRGADDWNWGLYYAAEGGHMHIVQLMIERGAHDWNAGMCGASRNGHMPIVQLMIDKGANDWNRVMYLAAESGHIPIVLLMIEKGAKQWPRFVVRLLQKHPEEIIHLARRGHVSQHLFAKHSSLFVQWIQEDQQVRATAHDLLLLPSHSSCSSSSNITLLPRELCELALSY